MVQPVRSRIHPQKSGTQRRITSVPGIFGNPLLDNEMGRKIGGIRPGFCDVVYFDDKGRSVAVIQPGMLDGDHV